MNSAKLQDHLVDEKGRAARLARSTLTSDQIVQELYFAAYSRSPLPDEQSIAAKAIANAGPNKQQAIEDVMWALLNSAEFVFNH
jgi:hypothetical protein